jgi:hypothetical protein
MIGSFFTLMVNAGYTPAWSIYNISKSLALSSNKTGMISAIKLMIKIVQDSISLLKREEIK